MKIKLLFLTCIAMVSLSSCKDQCHDCHYDVNGTEVEIGEYCGDELEAIEAGGFAVGDTTYEVHCHEH
jgi:hypothetical protein